MANQVVIMRGVSGSGKSTYAKKHFPTGYRCSADDFFTDVVGEGKAYVFDAKRLGEAHRWCMSKFIRAVTHLDKLGRNPLVVVDNTNLALWEFMGYYQVATAMGYEVTVIRMDTPAEVAGKRNLHGVPVGKVVDMQRRFQHIPSFLGIEEKVVKGY